MALRLAVALALGAVLMGGCGEKQDPYGPDAGVDEDVTYGLQIKPILDANCTRCHASDKQGAARNGASVGFDYDTYEAAVETADQANAQIQAGAMPVGGQLRDKEKGLFQAWVDQGTPE